MPKPHVISVLRTNGERIEAALKAQGSRPGVIRIHSIVYPYLWATALMLPLALITAYFCRHNPLLRYGLFFLGAAASLVNIPIYSYYVFTDPDRLQSIEIINKEPSAPMTTKVSAV